MKKLFLVVVLCCAFSMHVIATTTSSDTKMSTIEKEINVLKAKRADIEKNLNYL